MAWVTPTSYTTGQIVTAASFNQFAVSNPAYLKGQAGSIAFEDGAQFSGCVNFSASVAAPNAQFSGSIVAQGTLGIVAAGGNQRLMLGNSGGGASPILIQGTNGQIFIGLGTSFTATGGCNISTKVYIAGCQVSIGASTLNANMTQGLTIDQGTATNEILSLRASGSVAHGMTTLAETDIFAKVTQAQNSAGGVLFDAYQDSDTIEATAALVIRGIKSVAAASTRSTSGNGVIQLIAGLKSGTGATNIAANGNLFSVGNFTAGTRFIVDAEGDVHADAAVTASAYDAYNDIGLVRALELHRAPDTVVRDVWDEWVRYTRDDLERMKIATFNDHPGGDGSIFINYFALARLHSGALWQMHKRVAEVERATALLADLLAAPSRIRGWVTGVGRRLLGRRGPSAGRR